MSFKKVGINYISDKLLKCLLQDGSKYYVELKNGIRIPVAQADYEAIATDLVVVNGVAYADLSVIASCKQLVGGYIVEFANGNQLTTTELNFNALVEVGFCAIGDTYYNPAQIDKLYEANGAYFAQFKNGQTKPITEEEYEAIVGGEPGPEPGGLTPFSGTQSTTGIEINTNGLPTSSIDSWLASLDNQSGTQQLVQFVAVEGNSVCYAENGFESGPLFGHFTLWIMTASGLIVYNPSQISGSGLPTINAGWYITDLQLSSFTPISGDNDYSFGTSVQTTVVSENAQAFSTINGVVVGAVVAEPASELTAFEVGDNATRIQFDTSLSVAEVEAIVGQYGDPRIEFMTVLDEDNKPYAEYLTALDMAGVRALCVKGGDPVWISAEIQGFGPGWAPDVGGLDENGVWTCSTAGWNGEITVLNNTVQGWNGVLCGKVASDYVSPQQEENQGGGK